MTIKTDLSKKQLATILSALDDAPRNPANKGEALRAIGRSAAKLGLTTEDVLAAAPGLLDERLSPAEFRAELADTGGQEAGTEAAEGASEADTAATPAEADAADDKARHPRPRATTEAPRPTTRPRLPPARRPRSRHAAPARSRPR